MTETQTVAERERHGVILGEKGPTTTRQEKTVCAIHFLEGISVDRRLPHSRRLLGVLLLAQVLLLVLNS